MSQHMEALKRANEVRLGRAAIKRDLKRGVININDMIVDPPVALHSMTVFELLTSLDRWGRERTIRLLKEVKFSEYIKVGDLTDRQQRVLVSHLNRRR